MFNLVCMIPTCAMCSETLGMAVLLYLDVTMFSSLLADNSLSPYRLPLAATQPQLVPRTRRPALPHRDRSSSAPNVCMNLVNTGDIHMLEVRQRALRCCCDCCVRLSLLQPVVARYIRAAVGVDATPDDALSKVAVYRRGLVDVRV